MLEAAVDVTQCSCGLFDHSTRFTGCVLELHAEHAALRPDEPVYEPAPGFVQRYHDAAPG